MFSCKIFSFGISSRTTGAHRIAYELRKNDWDCEVIDWTMWWTLEELQNFARNHISKDIKWIGFSHLFYTWNDQLEFFCKWLKAEYPGLYIFSGSNAWPNIQSTQIDYYFQGYSEHAILALCKQLFSNGEAVKYHVDNKGRKVILPNKDYIAAPYRDPIIIYEDRDYIQSDEWLGIEFSRGCKFQCDFCNFPMLGVKGDYSRDADSVERQIKDAYHRFGVTRFVVTDETFNDRLSKIKKFADVSEALPFDPLFTGFLRGDLIVSKPKMREELLRMGFIGHYYGIESFNYETAKIVGKGMHPEKLQAGLIETKNYFLKYTNNHWRGEISLIVGLPHETESSIRQTKKWLIDNWKGQRFQPFAMDIPKEHEDKNSLISLDFKKYGYSEMTPHEITKKQVQRRTYYDHSPFASKFPENIIWKNEHMDVFDAVIMANELDMLARTKNFTIGAFRLAQVGLPQDLDALFALTIRQADKIEITDNAKCINKYKESKIG